ncbi:MAG: hypothetical protein Harvfovirus12_3 [Harvfovirus sp.]|uniref:Uncharacterized protein n=1 Tax=Harvfovirus sp. TaxID=2487768 RepID=A0A3G5A175_9VIRU|nr:MAG: hypothetical protein Harvfovirus12_3 [Harvfovirus sp.]
MSETLLEMGFIASDAEPESKETSAEGDWATVQIPATIPFFGIFLEVITTGKTPIDKIRFSVKEARETGVEADAMYKKWDELIKKQNKRPIVRMPLEEWPLVPSVVKGVGVKAYGGYYVDANAFAYFDAVDTDGCAYDSRLIRSRGFVSEEKQIVKKVNIIIYYIKEGRSLYWSEAGSLVQNCMSLESVKAVFVGETSPFFSSVLADTLSKDVIRSSCFSLEAKCGFLLNLNVQTETNRTLWLRQFKYILGLH